MRLTSWNLLHGMAIPPTEFTTQAQNQELLQSSLEHLNSDAAGSAMVGAHVLGVQEVDYLLERSGTRNQVGDIAKAISAAHWAFAPSVMGSPDEKWRGTNQRDIKVVTSDSPDQENGAAGYGIGLISQIPVRSWHRLDLSAAPIGILMAWPENGKMKRHYVKDHPRSAIAAVLDNGWLIVNTHLSFVPIFNLVQLLKIKRWIKKLPISDKRKIVVMGDLNLPFAFMVKGINWNSLAKQKTFPSWIPKVQIDFILSQKVAAEDVAQVKTEHLGISDHLPLSIDLDTE